MATEEKRGDVNIPSSTHVSESAVVDATIDKVWCLVSDITFSFSSLVKAVEKDKSLFGGVHVIKYKDGTSQTIQVVEFSELHHFITYNVVVSEPSVKYTSAVHTIRLRPVTVPVGGVEAQTFVEWTTDFSNDAKIDVIEDSRFKKREAFGDLAKVLKSSKSSKSVKN